MVRHCVWNVRLVDQEPLPALRRVDGGAPRAPLARASAPASDPGDPGEAPARGASMPRTVSSGRVRVVHTDPAEEAARHGISLSGSAAAAP